MSKIAGNLTELIETRLVELSNYNRRATFERQGHCKWSILTPGEHQKIGSGYSMIKDAEEKGYLKKMR